MSQSEVRIGDKEREQAVGALGEHYLAGRLTKEEYDERAETAWTARTFSQLRPLFADLPYLEPPQPVPAPVPTARPGRSVARTRGRRAGIPLLPLVLLVVLVFALTPLHLPWWGWLLIAWLWFSGGLAGLLGCGRRN